MQTHKLVATAEHGKYRFEVSGFITHDMVHWGRKPLEINNQVWKEIKSDLLNRLNSLFGHDKYEVIKLRLTVNDGFMDFYEDVKWK